jgi:hypothetical protein
MIGRHGTCTRGASVTDSSARRRNGAKAQASGTIATTPVAEIGRPPIASARAEPRKPPSVQDPWNDGRIGRW